MASLFHSLVVIGAGVSASACGGVTSVGSGGTSDEAAGGNGAGGVANRGSGGVLNAGAQTGIGLGGAVSGGTGGTLIIADGGAAGGPGTFPLPDAGTLAQWNCTDRLGGCSRALAGALVNPYYLSISCPVEPNRPRSAADCATTEWFRCLAARTGDVVIAVNCECAPTLDAGCSCDGFGPSDIRTAECHGHDMTCGCAYTGITH